MRKKGMTFILEVKDTQAKSWQGKIKWIEGRQEETFQSILDMITLLDSVIEVDKNTGIRDPMESEIESSQTGSGINRYS